MTRAGGCLDEGQIVLLLEGKLAGEEHAAVEAHLDGCESCRLLVGCVAPTVDGSGSGRESEPGPMLARGDSLGRYLLLSLLGEGGMGRVYAAYDPELDRRVALKLLHIARGAADARRRLLREARALGKLSHPNVVQVYDAGEHEGDVFVAMELVEGTTLGAWCAQAPRPGWREVLAAYLDAARGIEAAHAAGLVHRDVKPSNILRGKDGRVRVADFGLVAGGDGAPARAETESPRADAGDPLTVTGALMGTPLYMSPEQHEGRRVTAASDQYSLCVALHEGLYGAPPFTIALGPDVLGKLLAIKRAGPPAAAIAGAPVPAWVYQVIRRGLAPRAEDRHPSIAALIAALGADPEARKRARRLRAGAGVAVAALLALAAAGWARSDVLRDPCAHPERQLSGAWDDAVKGRVHAALLGAGRTYGEATAARVEALLDRYGAAWASMRAEVCEASLGGRARAELAGLRDACLDRRRRQLQALTTLLAEKPDPQLVDRAVQAAAALPPISYCADTEALTARVRPPEDPAIRARVAELGSRVDRLEALHRAGKHKEGLSLGEPLLAEVAQIAYPPLRAEVELWVGKLRDAAGDYDGAKALLRRAVVSAAEGRDDRLAADAWAQLLFVAGDRQRRFEEASVLLALGPAAVARAEDERVQATWASTEGTVLMREGKLAEARAAYERSLALRERVLGPDHPDTASALHNLGGVLCAMNDCWAARAALERAVAISERSLGPDHPDTAMSISNLGNALRRVGEYQAALDVQERALAIKEKTRGPDHPTVAASLNNVGSVLFDLGDYPRAATALERALAIKEKTLGPDHPDVSHTLAKLARVRTRLGVLEAALPLAERARRLVEAKEGVSQAELAEPLLALAEIHLARGAPGEAAVILERARSLGSVEFTPEIDLALAEALWAGGGDHARARSLAEHARDEYQRIHHRPGAEKAERWLAAHPG